MSGVDNPDEIERAAAQLSALEKSLAQEEQRIRSTMNHLHLRTTDPGGRIRAEVTEAARQVNLARIKLDENAKRMRRVAQELRNTRIS